MLKYTGREQDSETGFYYYRARYYDPITGKFISEDPKGFGGGSIILNAYADNNPINYNDPFGFDKTCECSSITFSAVGPNQATGIGALGISPPNNSLAISPGVFGLAYGTIPERVASQNAIKDAMDNVTISVPGLSNYNNGSTIFTIGDVGDSNIRNSPTPRFDIYRFGSQQDALSFGKQSFPATITGLPDTWSCPSTCSVVNPVPQTNTLQPQSSIEEDNVAAADGGFVLYPNKSNTNQMRSVYAK